VTRKPSTAKTLSLSKAVFIYGMSAEDSPPSEHPAPSIDADHMIAELESDLALAEPLSQSSLERILLEMSGAEAAKINLESCTFSFAFGGEVYEGAPWTWAPPHQPSGLDPREQAEALFGKEGLVSAEGERPGAPARLKAVQHAASLVWNQYMFTALDRAIADRRLEVLTRIGQVTAKPQALPSAAWPVMTVLDWENGVATDLSATLHYDIRIRDLRSRTNLTVKDENSAIRTLAQRLRENEHLTREQSQVFLRQRGITVSDRGFQWRVWPAAREKAGLSPLAPRGPKPKS